MQTSSQQPFLPRYRVAEIIGEGAAARVYRVVDARDGSVRAIKALKSENSEPSVIRRFEYEYRILRGLHHPSLPEVYDYGIAEDGTRYIVMELVEGEPLERYFQGHREDLWLLLYELCEVLSFIHHHNLLHLDLKPSNILVKRTTAYGGEKPIVMLMDFGLSYRRDVGQEVALVGTPEYMAPEVIRGDSRLTRAADYYSLGITLFQLLTGETPFGGDLGEVFAGHLTREVRFREEKTEYAELYPHVLGLVAKDTRNRLEAFEDFRRAVDGRLGGGVAELDRAYGLSFISSVGMIGKEEVWKALGTWLGQVSSYSGENIGPDGGEATAGATQLTQGNARLTEPATVVILTGPKGSGKSYLLTQLMSELKIREYGTHVVSSGNRLSISAQSLEGTQVGSLPHEERLARLWEELLRKTNHKGNVLFFDDYDALCDEDRDLLSYVRRRMELPAPADEVPRVLVVVTSANPRLKSSLGITPGGTSVLHLSTSMLREEDIRQVVSGLPGSQVVAADKDKLIDFLRTPNLNYDGLLNALRESVLRTSAMYHGGAWRFSLSAPSRVSAGTIDSEYFKVLLSDMDEQSRTMLFWLSCHQGMISLPDLAAISGGGEDEIMSTVAQLRPFGLLDVHGTGPGTKLGIAGERTRTAIRSSAGGESRKRMHAAYIEHYKAALAATSGKSREDIIEFYSQLARQYEMLGDYRGMFKTNVAIVRFVRADNDIRVLRRVCRDSADAARSLKRRWKEKSWHIERYFLKAWLEAEWRTNNYNGVIYVARLASRRSGHVPLSFLFKFGLAMEMSGRSRAMLDVVIAARGRIQHMNSALFVETLLLEAMALVRLGRVNRALSMLRTVKRREKLLSDYGRCRLHMGFAECYSKLKGRKGLRPALSRLERFAKRHGYTNELLVALSGRFGAAFEETDYRAAMEIAKHALRLAARKGLIHRKGMWFYRCSGVYFETGDYKRALRYAGQSLSVAYTVGNQTMACELLTRIGMNYQNMGLYGNALNYAQMAEIASKAVPESVAAAEAHLFSVDIALSLKSVAIERYVNRMTNAMAKTERAWKREYYYYLLGQYCRQKFEFLDAAKYFRMARIISRQAQVVDDEMRSAIKETWAYIEMREYRKAQRLLAHIDRRMRAVKSRNIVAEYWGVRLAYCYRRRAPELKSTLRTATKHMSEAYEKPTVLELKKLLFRVNARLGHTDEATSYFREYIAEVKRIAANIEDQDAVNNYLDTEDERLLRREFALLSQKR